MARRILIFSLTYLPFVGGAEIALKEIAGGIDPEQIEFDLITVRFDRSLPKVAREKNLNIHRIGFTAPSPTMQNLSSLPLSLNKYLFPALALATAARLHRRRQYDAVWSMMANYAGFAALFFKLTHPRVRFVLTLQEGDPLRSIQRRVRWISPLFRRIFTSADHVQAISEHLAGFARDMGAARAVTVVPNGVRVRAFAVPDQPAAERLRASLGVADRSPRLITVSRLVTKNGIDDIIRCLAHLPESAVLLIAGLGPEEQSLKELARSAQVQDRVRFLGQVSHAELPLYLKTADVFVRPSLSEGMGNAFLEAMAAGIPVIATQVGGIVDFLKDPDQSGAAQATGLFCAVRDPQSIARQVERIMSDQSLRAHIVNNALRMVRERYDWSAIAAEMKTKVFDSVV